MKSTNRQKNLIGFAAAAVIAIGVAGAFGSVSQRVQKSTEKAPLSHIVSVKGEPVRLGGAAPEITWRDPVKGTAVRLSDFRGKPVVFFSGSVTCPPFQAYAGLVESYARKYQGKVQFLFAYSREAHTFVGPTPYTAHPKTIGDRDLAARDVAANAGFTMPILIDNLQNRVEKVCGNIPSRILVIDQAGKVAFISDKDPRSTNAMPVPAVLDRLLAAGS